MNVLLFLLICIFGASAGAADAQVEVFLGSDGDDCSIHVVGQVAAGDAARVRKQISAIHRTVGSIDDILVCLEGPGGNLLTGFNLAEFFYFYGINTKVERGASCLSACAIAFLGGSDVIGSGTVDEYRIPNRTISSDASLGFHGPYLDFNNVSAGQPEQLTRAFDVGQDVIIEFLTNRQTLQVSEDFLIGFLRVRGENEFYFFDNVGQAISEGIFVESANAEISQLSAAAACFNAINFSFHVDDLRSIQGRTRLYPEITRDGRVVGTTDVGGGAFVVFFERVRDGARVQRRCVIADGVPNILVQGDWVDINQPPSSAFLYNLYEIPFRGAFLLFPDTRILGAR